MEISDLIGMAKYITKEVTVMHTYVCVLCLCTHTHIYRNLHIFDSFAYRYHSIILALSLPNFFMYLFIF